MMILASVAALLFGAGTAQAKVIERIPSHYVRVRADPGPNPPGQISRALVYLDGPVLLLRGTWTNPDELENVPEPRSPVPELVAPVRVVLPGAYKFIDLESRDSVLGEIEAETYTPESRIYRVYLPISGITHTHKFQVVFHAGLKVPFNIVTSFEPPDAIVVRSPECVRQGVSLDAAVEGFQPATEGNILYLFCQTDFNNVHVGVYAPLDRRWLKYGYGARKVFADHGLYFALPRPPMGVMVPETVTEFTLEGAGGKPLKYELRYDPPFRPRLLNVNLALGPSYHHYDETRLGASIDQLGFWGKFSTQLNLDTTGFAAYADIYGVIQDINHSPSTKPPADQPLPALQYFGINVRAGYVEPVTPIEHEWSFMAGWYFWRFYVVGGAYGIIDRLAGPEAFVQYKYQGLRRTPWWVNARWVFLTDHGWPNDIHDYEASLGGGFDVAWVGKRRPLSLNADLSRLQWYSGDRNMTLHNFVVYLSYPLY